MDVGFLIKKLVHFMECRVIHLDDGQMIIALSTKEIRATNVLISYLVKAMICIQNQLVKLKLLKTMCIVEFHLVNNKTIYKDNVTFLRVNFQIIHLLKTLAQDSTIKDQDFLNSWNFLIENALNKSSFQAKTDFVASDLNCYNGNSLKTIQNSWFLNKLIKHQSKNSLRIFLPFYKYLLVDGIPKDDTLLRTRKIKLKLTSIQKKTFKIWSDHSRYSYNKAINFINNSSSEKDIAFRNFYDTKPENINVFYSDFELRDLITPKEVCSRIPWILQTPKGIREGAVFEAKENLRKCLTNFKNGHINHFKLRFKSKKNSKWTITVPHDSINVYEKAVGIYEGRTTHFRVRTTEKIGEINSDCMIHFDGLSYFICVPFTVEKKTNSQNWFAALDPGSRKFQTIYCPDEETYVYLGERASDALYKNLITLDNLLSNKNSKNGLKIKKLRLRIENLQKELHCKSINFLCNSYQNIYIPKLTRNNDIIRKVRRKLRTKTVRQMVVLGHCKFVERLKTKAEEFTNVKVHIISEEYTSQKCLRCNGLTKTAKEIFNCDFCNLKVDRDILGSTNILLKNW